MINTLTTLTGKPRNCIDALLLAICLLLCAPVMAQPYERAEVLDSAIRFANVPVDGDRIHYAHAGDEDKPGIIFIHGTPGGWGAFEVYLSNKSLQQDFFMVSVDRLGWGASQLNRGLEMNAAAKKINARKTGVFEVQARSILAVMARYPGKRWLLVGHSLGASIAPKIAVLDDEKVAGMLLLAGSLKPNLGKPRWYNRAASTLLVRWMLPAALKYSNDEIMALRKQLSLLDKEITDGQFSAKVVIMQGMKDKLVSPKNPQYALENWQSHFSDLQTIELPEAGHFLPWEQTPLVIETIRQFEF
ncbi:MAG: alpha/beta hydrolase [Pseudomonadota bacterium]